MARKRYLGSVDGVYVNLSEVEPGVVEIDNGHKHEGSRFDLDGTPANKLAILKGYKITDMVLIPPYTVHVVQAKVDPFKF